MPETNLRRFGSLAGGTVVIQPDSELVYHDDGLIDGTLSIKADASDEETLRGRLGEEHPNNPDVMLYALRIRFLTNSVIVGTYDCVGTEGRKDTERICAPQPATEMIPIEAHPQFLGTALAGPESSLVRMGLNYATGANGARFQVDPQTRKPVAFLGFMGPDAPQEFRALKHYERNTPVLRISYYTWQTPTFAFNSQIVRHPQGAPEFAGILNWLRKSPPATRVGGFNGNILWKISLEYVGSETGWSEVIYGPELEEG